MKQLAITVPMFGNIVPPAGVPNGNSGIFAVNDLVGVALDLAIVVAIILALFFLVTAGLEWTASGGDKAKIEHARGRIILVIIGIGVVLGSFFILSFVEILFGVDLVGMHPHP